MVKVIKYLINDLYENNGQLLHCFSFDFPLLSIIFHYFSKLFPISIKCQRDVNMK
jgi:hypothetical protein